MQKALKFFYFRALHLARLAGIEPTTPWFVAKYSIQLSYSRAKKNDSLAEREGFEPSVMLPPRLISSQVHSTTLPPLRIVESAIVAGFLGPHEKFTLKYAEIYATKRSKPPM